jgi:hypothetical protein
MVDDRFSPQIIMKIYVTKRYSLADTTKDYVHRAKDYADRLKSLRN